MDEETYIILNFVPGLCNRIKNNGRLCRLPSDYERRRNLVPGDQPCRVHRLWVFCTNEEFSILKNLKKENPGLDCDEYLYIRPKTIRKKIQEKRKFSDIVLHISSVFYDPENPPWCNRDYLTVDNICSSLEQKNYKHSRENVKNAIDSMIQEGHLIQGKKTWINLSKRKKFPKGKIVEEKTENGQSFVRVLTKPNSYRMNSKKNPLKMK